MNKHEPKPLVEEHWHIQELIDGQQKRVDDKEYHREKEKEKQERNKLILEAPLVVVTDFYCHQCQKDFKSMAIRQLEQDWTFNQFIAFYKTKCNEGHWCIRYITDKYHDPYWMRSKSVARDRGTHYKDIIQPFETGYNMIYGKQ